MDRAIITAASNKFFPSLVNLLGSIKHNYPSAPCVFVYDLGLMPNFKKELEAIENVEVIQMPKFVRFWRSCYTWKTYILAHPLARLNFYLDAGTQVLRPLDPIFDFIQQDDYFAVSQDVPLGKITPEEYKHLFRIDPSDYKETCITAGIFGFKRDSSVTPTLNKLYQTGVTGLCLGFSSGVGERWKNKGVNKSPFVRGCEIFRHDTTMISLLMRQDFKNFKIHELALYGGLTNHDHPEQCIWNLRLHYTNLEFLNPAFLHKKIPTVVWINRTILSLMIFAKRVIKKFKGLKY